MMPAAEDSTMCNEELLASSMAQSLRIPHAVARFLVARGVRTLTEAHRMLCGNADDVHDPFLMKGMEEAVAWLLDVRERGEKVFVFGDYDLDGMTAVTLLTRCLKTVGIDSDGDSRTALAMATDSRFLLSTKCTRRGLAT